MRLSRAVFYPPLNGSSDRLCLKEHRKCIGRPWNQMGRKNSPGPDYADDFSILLEEL